MKSSSAAAGGESGLGGRGNVDLFKADASLRVLHRTVQQKLLPSLARLQHVQAQLEATGTAESTVRKEETVVESSSGLSKRKRAEAQNMSLAHRRKMKTEILGNFIASARQLDDVWQEVDEGFTLSLVVPQLSAEKSSESASLPPPLARLPMLLNTGTASGEAAARELTLYSPDHRFRNVQTSADDLTEEQLLLRHNEEVLPTVLQQLVKLEAELNIKSRR